MTKKYYELNKNGIVFLWGDRVLWSYLPMYIPIRYIHMILRDSLRDHTGSYGTIRDHTEPNGPYRTIWDHTGHIECCEVTFQCTFPLTISIWYWETPYWTLRDHTGPYGTIRDNTGQYGTILDHTGPCETTGDHMGPYGTIQDHSGPHGTLGDHTGP